METYRTVKSKYEPRYSKDSVKRRIADAVGSVMVPGTIEQEI